MGRKSRAKRERREQSAGPIASVAEGRSRASLLALVEAASVSPNASQYLPSLSVIYETVVTGRMSLGERRAEPELLYPLVKAAHRECPSLAAEEDDLPHDPRYEVRVEWGGEWYRMVGGTLERPTSVIEMLRRLAGTVDPVLQECAGYGLTDIVGLVLRRVDAVIGVLGPTWPQNREQELGAVPELRPEELAAAGLLPVLECQIAECDDPGRARAALDAHSMPARSLRREAMSPVATFGSTIAVRDRRGFTALPAGLMVEALNAIADEVAIKSLRFDASLDAKWRQVVWQYVGDMFVGAGNDTIGPLRDPRYPYLHSVIRYNDSQYLAVGVAARLDHSVLDGTIAAAAGCLEKVKPGNRLRTVHGTESIPPSVRLFRLLIVAAPQAIQAILTPSGSECTVITLQDFDWIRRTMGREEIDLWYFVRDLVEQRKIGQIFAWDGIDLWETWRGQGKSLYRGARQLDMVYVEPHHSRIEWRKAAEQRHIELALHILQMGRISEWPLHHLEGPTKVIGNVLLGAFYQLVICETPVAVALQVCSGIEPAPGLVRRLGDCIAYKLEYTKDQFVNLMRSSGLSSLRIEFAFDETAQDFPLCVASFDGGVLTFGCAPTLQEDLQEDCQSVEAQFGFMLAEAIVDGEGTGDFIAAWNDSPPAIRFDPILVGPQIQQTPEAASLHAAHRNARLTELGAHLEDAGVLAGSYSGSDAKRIESGIVYRWLIARLHEYLAAFTSNAVLGYALTQLEYTNCHRWWVIEKTAYEVGPPRPADGRLPESNQDLLRQSRSISLLVEEIVARPPTGASTPTEFEWQDLLSLATLAVESSYRSEALHLELADYTLIVSNDYEVSISESNLTASVDIGSFTRDRSLAALPDSVPIGTRENRIESSQEWTPIGVRLPEYEAIEQSLQDSLGFGIDAIGGILEVIIRWPVSSPRCTDLVSPERIVTDAHPANPAITRRSYREAIAWLSLGTDDFDLTEPMIEHWEVEPRSARIDTRPLARSESKVWVSPWTAEIAARIWRNYLSQHRMPRPDSELPQPVVSAFEGARQARQREFEKDCEARLDGLRLIKVGRVRKRHAQKHGIQSLSGEIDILCIDPDRSVIFIIEAKDPFVPMSARSIRRQVAQFHKPDGYVDKLAKKVEDIKKSAVSLAANKGVDPSDRDWRIFGIMVTRHVTPAAYLRTCQTTFCTVNTLRETIKGAKD